MYDGTEVDDIEHVTQRLICDTDDRVGPPLHGMVVTLRHQRQMGQILSFVVPVIAGKFMA